MTRVSVTGVVIYVVLYQVYDARLVRAHLVVRVGDASEDVRAARDARRSGSCRSSASTMRRTVAVSVPARASCAGPPSPRKRRTDMAPNLPTRSLARKPG
jgi:hypothetical protein